MKVSIQLVCIALSSALAPAVALAAAQHARLVLPERVEVAADVIRLADLLPASAPAALLDSAKQVELGYAPRPGHWRVLSGERIKQKLAASPSLAAHLSVPEKVFIGREYRLLTRKEVFATIRASLATNGYSGVTVRPLADRAWVAPVRVTRDDPGLRVTRIEFDPARNLTRFRLWASDEPASLPFWVLAHLESDVPALQARRLLFPGDIVAPADFESAPLHSPRDLSQPILRAEELAGLRVRRRIRKGESVEAAWFAPAIEVRRNHPAQLTMQGRTVRISCTVTALEDGINGQFIRVRNLATKQILRARVIAPGRLRASF